MPAPELRPVTGRDASETPLAAIRNRFAPQPGTLAISASSRTGEGADHTGKPAGGAADGSTGFSTRRTLDA